MSSNGAVLAEWAFADARDVAVLTTEAVLHAQQPILFVSHDIEDGLWQFLERATVDAADVRYATLAEIVRCDPGIAELARLPLGWEARRRDPDAPWSMYPRCC